MFVMANLTVDNTNSDSIYLFGYADADKNNVANQVDIAIRGAINFCFPVRKGEWFKIHQKSNSTSGVHSDAMSVDFVLDGYEFGQVQPMDNVLVNKIQQTDKDLFFLLVFVQRVL